MVLMAGIGGLLMLIGSLWFLATLLFALRATKTTGVITGARESRTSISGTASARVFAPQVRFQTAQGQQVDFVSNVATSVSPQVGAPIEVLYLTSNPHKAKVTGCRMWVGPLILPIVGMFIAGVGAAVAAIMPG